MSGIIGIPFGLRFLGFEFGAVETLLLVVTVATALVSLVEVIRLSIRERGRERVARLHGAIIERTGLERATRMPWYDRLGAILANSPLVGATEQRRLTAKLTLADVSEADLEECADRARAHYVLLCAQAV